MLSHFYDDLGNDFAYNVRFTSFGLAESQGGTRSLTLQKVELPIVDIYTCMSDYFNDNIVDTNTMICADPRRGGKSTCQGDSGGPLQCETPEGIYVLAGSTSWGTKCAEAGKPSVFAKIAKQVDWIHSVAGPTP
ncbi:plasma kallikrein [Ixodes scapularis]